MLMDDHDVQEGESMNGQDAIAVVALDHVNIRTTRVSDLVAFYESVLGLTAGPRPPFSFAGAWLYCGDRPVIHLVEVAAAELPPAHAPQDLRLSHFAFRATGLGDLIARLRAAQIPHQVAPLPGHRDVVQVHVTDPDGNALHVDVAGERPPP
jgi:catechol-2,3-dioxygenase